ncbi:hypothetical protein FQN50_001196 [Emmonsiellopsis sp. PD_5]|nr:hypothetical protein FQN50_001196 [Emmonsiellopsis sp. PD_5]
MSSTTTSSKPPAPSSLTTLTSTPTTTTPNTPQTSLTTQILHNLEHQHRWTALQTHPPHTLSPTQHNPLISGQPPQTIYTHPDEQAFMLEHGISVDDVPTDREWVIPTAQGQSWSLAGLAGCFDALPDTTISNGAGNNDDGAEEEEEMKERWRVAKEKEKKSKEEILVEYERRKRGGKSTEWGGKRALLAMVNRGMGGDGTVVYYVVLEGCVKPRQN